MENNVLLGRINKYQKAPVFHPLTCGNDSNHENLKPIVRNGKVILVCSDCNYKQEYIPDFFYHEKFEQIYEQQRKLIESIHNSR